MNLQQDIGKCIAFILSDFKSDSKISIFCSETTTLLGNYYKELQKNKNVDEIRDSVVALFESSNSSQPYIIMLSHVIDFLATPIIEKIHIEVNKQKKAGNIT